MAIITFLGCQKSNQAAPKSEQRYFLVSHAGAGDPFWNIVFSGAKQAQTTLGVDLQILAPETANDIARQVELLNAAIAAKPKGIALSIPDDQAFSASLKEAEKLGIPVIAFNTHPNEKAKANNPYLAFIGMDDTIAGQKLAEEVRQSGRIKERVVVAIHQAGHVGLERRYMGIKNELLKNNITVDKLDISVDASQAQQIIHSYLQKNPTTSAIFFVGSFGIHAASRWLNKEYPQVLQASFDLTPLTLEQIKNNALSMSVDQQPFMQGYMAIIELDLKSRFDLSPADVNTGVALVDKTGINQLAELVKKGVR